MKLDLNQFYKFCSELKIETKEQGLKKLDTLLGTQTFAMNEIAQGLDEDIHHFVILKGRQLGVTKSVLPSTCISTLCIQACRARW